MDDAKIQKARDLLAKARTISVLTGAGISAESGLKTFRDSGGLWEDHPVEQVATPQGFAQDPALVWRFYNARRRAADQATPNPAHLALARMELQQQRTQKKSGRGTNGNGNGKHPRSERPPFVVLTQNIDGLHQQAGSQRVIELHGSVWNVRCNACGVITNEYPIELPILPRCEACQGLLRPDVVWFGEALDPEVLREAEEAVLSSDVVLVVGTSGVVHPAAAFPFMAAHRQIPVIEVNKEFTPISAAATVTLIGSAGEILPALVTG